MASSFYRVEEQNTQSDLAQFEAQLTAQPLDPRLVKPCMLTRPTAEELEEEEDQLWSHLHFRRRRRLSLHPFLGEGERGRGTPSFLPR